MNIVFVYSDNFREINSSHYRCLIPARALRAAGHKVETVFVESFEHGHADALLSDADVIVVERNFFGGTPREMHRWSEQGKLVVADFDDPYDMITPSHGPAYQLWMQGIATRNDGMPMRLEPHPQASFRTALGYAGLATTPCQRLCDDWAPHTRQIRLRPNWLDWSLYETVHRDPHAGVWIGWGGSNGHLQSFARSGLLVALRRVMRARAEVQLHLYGLTDSIADQLDVPQDRLVVRNWETFDRWPQGCAQFDVGLAPLAGAYDERRSWLKPLEYMACGVPWIASDFPNYRELGAYGVLVRNTPDDWERAILERLERLSDCQAQALLAPRERARAECADQHVNALIAMFTQAQAEVLATRQVPARVSVVIPCYNMANYLPDAVVSVVAQTYPGWEMVIVDDGSTDDTPAMIESLQKKYPTRRIRSVRQENAGLPAARNAGIRVATGEFVLPLDADDVLLPDALKRLLAVLDEHPEIGIAYPDYIKLGLEAGTVFAIPTEEYYDPQRALNGLPYCSLYRHTVWEQVGGYDVEMRGAIEDWEFWLHCLEHGVKALHVQEPLFAYRVRADSQSVTAETILPEALARMRLKHAALFAGAVDSSSAQQISDE